MLVTYQVLKIIVEFILHDPVPGVSNLWSLGSMQPGMAVNVAQHKTIDLLKTL